MNSSRLTSRLLALHTLAVYLFLYIPIVIVIFFSFNSSRLVTRWEGFSWRWYIDLWNDRVMQASIQNSLIAGVSATVIATVVGTLAALALSRESFIGKRATLMLLLAPIVIPEIVVGAASLTFFATTRWHLSLLTVVIAHVTFSISYVAIVVRARLAGFDRSLEEAAMDLGATRWSMFWRVKLRLMAPGVIAAALLVFTLSIDDYVITSFVAGPQSTTLPLLIASKLRVKSDLPVVNAAATVLLVVTIALILISQRLLQPRQTIKTDHA